ncbi:hypothetical protein CHUAL_004789 [Chamberlinius hualienensis]
MAVTNLGRRFLLWCANEHNDFRIPEILSIASLFKINLEWVEKNTTQPYVVVDVPSIDDIKKLMSRSTLVRSAYELWGMGPSKIEMYSQLRSLPTEFLKSYSKSSFCIRVETFCRTLTLAEKIRKIEEFDFLPLEGPINLKNPEETFLLLEYYSGDSRDVSRKPTHVSFGRLICHGQRDKITLLNLKDRKFIGNTSMDPQLSLIMANQGLVERNSLVFDPFVGSGSVLVAAAYFGAYIWGVDIDYKMLHGKAKPTRCQTKRREENESVALNLQQYDCGSRYMDVIVGDSSRSMWRDNVEFDSIITDPPYGVRESLEKVGKKTPDVPEIKQEYLKTHIPCKVNYKTHEMYTDLLNYAAKHLKIGGRLVYWLPVFFTSFSVESIPLHSCLELVSYSEQELAKYSKRYLITMTKVRHPEGESDVTKVKEFVSSFNKLSFLPTENSTCQTNDRD